MVTVSGPRLSSEIELLTIAAIYAANEIPNGFNLPRFHGEQPAMSS